MCVDVRKLAQEIINGKRLTRESPLHFFKTCDLTALCEGADAIRKHFCGEKVELCTIINGRSGKCSENCKFCAQSAENHTACPEYPLLEGERIFRAAQVNESAGVHRFSIVTSGKALLGREFEKAVAVYAQMKKELCIELCASMGFLSREQLRILKKAGVTRYHHNIETSKKNFPYICTTHTYEMKIQTIQWAHQEGLEVCSGGIVGMGETFEDRIDMAISLAELGVCSIPLNILDRIPGTPFENNTALEEADILRTIALFKFINPASIIRIGAGRKLLSGRGSRAFSSGLSAAITGDMLTTTGTSIAQDKEMLTMMGRSIA